MLLDCYSSKHQHHSSPLWFFGRMKRILGLFKIVCDMIGLKRKKLKSVKSEKNSKIRLTNPDEKHMEQKASPDLHRLCRVGPELPSLPDLPMIEDNPPTTSYKGNGSFSTLPEELIVPIFKFLPQNILLSRCALVCKRWQRISQDNSLWKEVIYRGKKFDFFILEKLLRNKVQVLDICAEIIKSVSLKKCTRSNSFMKLRNNIENGSSVATLRSLILYEAVVSELNLCRFLSLFTNLKELGLPDTLMTNIICSYVAANTNLESLNMTCLSGITDTGLENILQSCIKLDSLNLSYGYLLSQNMNVLSRCIPPSVTKLNLAGQLESLEDSHIESILQRCPNLTELDISESRTITLMTIKHIIKYGHKLKRFCANSCQGLPLDACSLLRNMKNLSHVEIFRMLNFDEMCDYFTHMASTKCNGYPIACSPMLRKNFTFEFDFRGEQKLRITKRFLLNA